MEIAATGNRLILRNRETCVSFELRIVVEMGDAGPERAQQYSEICSEAICAALIRAVEADPRIEGVLAAWPSLADELRDRIAAMAAAGRVGAG